MALEDDIAKFQRDAQRASLIVNGDASTVVETDGGQVDSMARAVSKIRLVGKRRVDTLAQLQQIVEDDIHWLAEVERDTRANNGVYEKTAPAGSPGWTKIGDTAIGEVRADLAPIADTVRPDTAGEVDGQPIAGAVVGDDDRPAVAWDTQLNTIVYAVLKLFGSGASFEPGVDPNILLGIASEDDRYFLKFSGDGKDDFLAGLGSGAGTGLPDVLHIIGHGQSEQEGAEAIPPVTTAETGHDAMRFARGARTWLEANFPAAPASRPDSDFQLVPLTEVVNGALGETPLAGAAAMFKEMLLGAYGPAKRSAPPMIVVTFAGQGGRMLRELDKRHARDPQAKFYDTMIDDVRRLKAWADKNQKSYAVAGVFWMQGPANNLYQIEPGGPVLDKEEFRETYCQDLMDYADDANADIRAITGQAGRVPLITYQTEGEASGEAQRRAAERHPHIYMIGPHYHVASAINSRYGAPETHGGRIHLAADGARWFGLQAGKVLGRIWAERENWQPLHPVEVRRRTDPKKVMVRLAGGRLPRGGRLVIDTTILPAQGSALGFEIRTGGPAVVGVAVVAPDTLELALAGDGLDAEATYTLRHGQQSYAFTASLPLAAIQDGPALPNGQASKDLVLAGPVAAEFATIASEGAFYVANAGNARFVVRQVIETGGQTILRGEARELTGTAFAAGDPISAYRPFSFGNIRDDDSATSPLVFADTSYNGRSGPYPLWNWLIAFEMEIR
ncbi:hypothetical protein ACFW16_24745 [Inquilinus sp. NPDC058860]|uniref:hypothetical protein n=1 Tax=Inquilinus sp. NPDC058860 TaxID=3346652 RepID=UPI0036A92472